MSRNKYAGILLGVLVDKEQEERLFGEYPDSGGLLEEYTTHVMDNLVEGGPREPTYSNSKGLDYVGLFLFTGAELLVKHYVERGLVPNDKSQVVELPDKDEVMDWRRGLHFAGLLQDALKDWGEFSDFCNTRGLELPPMKLYLVVDEE